MSALLRLVLLAVLLTGRSPSAQAAPPNQRQVLVAIAGSEQDVRRLSGALSEAMGRLGVVANARHVDEIPSDVLRIRASSDPTTPARLWIDLNERSSVTLYVADDQNQRVFTRRFETAAGFDEIALEQLLLATSSSVQAILEGRLIGVARQEYELAQAPKPPPEKQAVTPPARRSFGSLTGAYTLSWLGPGAIAHGPSLGVELEQLPFGLGVFGLGRLPVLVGEDTTLDGFNDLRVRLTALGFGARVWYAVPLTERVSLVPGVGLVGLFTQVSPRARQLDAASLQQPYWAADGLARGFIGMLYRGRGWSLTGSLGVDVALRAVRYSVQTPEGTLDVFTPFRLRPFIEVELAAALLE